MGRLPVVLLAVGLMMGSLLLGATPARAAAKSFTLYGDGIDGWGFTSGSMTSPGPTITVDQGDTVTMTLYSADSLPHTFHIDYDSDGAVPGGQAVTVAAGAANQGTVSDTTTVTAYAGAITIGSQTVTLAAGGSPTPPVSWG